ncbi:MAG: hypothetical protein IPH12_07395 [Saprospirales bacterium]|nr:hypothetical protein [Saprospirales bacterium]
MVCTNAQFTLNPLPLPNGNYTWTGSPGLSCYDCPSPKVSGLGPGVYTYIARVSGPSCTEASDTLHITVINGAAPQYVISPNREICLGDSVELGGPVVDGTFYNWYSVPPGFASNKANPKDKPPVPTLYYLSASNSTCPLPALDSVRVIPMALSLSVTPSDTVKLCRGNSRTFQAMVAPTGQPIEWTPPTGLQINASGTVAIASPWVSTLYTVTARLGGCSRSRQIFVAVDSLPEHLEILPADTAICVGDSIALTSPIAIFHPADYPDMTFKWSPLTGALRPDTVFEMVVRPSQPTIYRRITRNKSGVCTDTATVIVRLTPKPQITANPANSLICPGDTVLLSANYSAGVTSIGWSPGAGLSCTGCDEPLAAPGVTTVYIVTAKIENCSASDTVFVDLKALAPVQFPPDLNLCPGDSIHLNTVFDDDAAYTWTSTHPGFGTIVKPAPTYFPVQTATYFVEAFNGCTRRDTVTVFVSAATLNLDGDTTVCKNAPVTLSALVNLSGGSFQWTNIMSGQVEGTMAALTVAPALSTPYELVFTYGDNCRLRDTAVVSIDGEAPEIIFPADPKLCPGERIVLNSGPVLAGSTYVWSATPPDPTLQQGSAPEVAPTQNTAYTVTATNDACKTIQKIDVTAYKATLTVWPYPDTIVCAGSPVLLKASGSEQSGTYEWSSGELSAEILKAPDQPESYTVVYSYGDTCSLKKTVLINAVPSFDLAVQCAGYQPDQYRRNAYAYGLGVAASKPG